MADSCLCYHSHFAITVASPCKTVRPAVFFLQLASENQQRRIIRAVSHCQTECWDEDLTKSGGNSIHQSTAGWWEAALGIYAYCIHPVHDTKCVATAPYFLRILLHFSSDNMLHQANELFWVSGNQTETSENNKKEKSRFNKTKSKPVPSARIKEVAKNRTGWGMSTS